MAKYGVCENCGLGGVVERHEVYFGKNRQVSLKYDCLMINLCYSCHRQQPTGVHGGNIELDLKLKQAAQKEFEKIYSHKKFMEEIGRNYL